MYDTHASVLVRALTQLLVSRSLTSEDKRRVSTLLDDEITAVLSAGKLQAEAAAKVAVHEATKKLRKEQGVASRTSQKREQLRRVARNALRFSTPAR